MLSGERKLLTDVFCQINDDFILDKNGFPASYLLRPFRAYYIAGNYYCHRLRPVLMYYVLSEANIEIICKARLSYGGSNIKMQFLVHLLCTTIYL